MSESPDEKLDELYDNIANSEEIIASACRNGHVQDFFATARPDQLNTSIYCEICGEEVISVCQNCKLGALVVDQLNPMVYLAEQDSLSFSKDDLPKYCAACGDSFPWVNPIEAAEQRDGEFLNVDSDRVGGQFYPGLVEEINACYRIRANQATMILFRKLVESLLIDILRAHFGMERLELFYDTERGQPRGLSELIVNFGEHRSELRKHVNGIDEEFLRLVKEFKYHGDASAHSIENRLSDETIEDLSEDATHIAQVLFKLRTSVLMHHQRDPAPE